MARQIRTDRRGFSLLEMVLALAIGMILLAALYVTLNTHVTHTQMGRETLDEGTLARAILTRMANDIVNELGAVDPRVLPDYSAATGSTNNAMPMSTTTEQTSVAYNVGVRGDATTLALSMYRVQPATSSTTTNASAGDASSDLRRISYWMVTSGSKAAGLARQEIKLATSNDIETVPTDNADANKYIIAKEVRNVLFEYFDGKTWQTSWDGTALGGADGDLPIGPPAAIRITLTLGRRTTPPDTSSDSPNPDPVATYTHVVALPAGNNFVPQTTP